MNVIAIAKLHVLIALSLILCKCFITNFDQLAFSQVFDSSINLTGIHAPAKMFRYTDPGGSFHY